MDKDKFDLELVVNTFVPYIRKNVYYIPSIEEFHVGFEYYFCSAYQEGVSATEIIIDGKDGYEPKVFTFDVYNYNHSKGESWKDVFESMLTYEQIKVKYLDREDIESLGWKCNYIDQYFKDGYTILIDDDYFLQVLKDDSEEDIYLFQGTIKNKSELKVLLKQLGIE